ncbi:hypothetical protein D9M69_581120 [compost metagenome]
MAFDHRLISPTSNRGLGHNLAWITCASAWSMLSFSDRSLRLFFKKIASASARETNKVSLAVAFCALPEEQRLTKKAVNTIRFNVSLFYDYKAI